MGPTTLAICEGCDHRIYRGAIISRDGVSDYCSEKCLPKFDVGTGVELFNCDAKYLNGARGIVIANTPHHVRVLIKVPDCAHIATVAQSHVREIKWSMDVK